jgi:hypothetical protein
VDQKVIGNKQVLFDGDICDDDEGIVGGGHRQSKFQSEHILQIGLKCLELGL